MTPMTHASQRERLLHALRSGRWRSLAYLVFGLRITRLSGRVYELRKQGHVIIWREHYRGIRG